MHHGESTSTAAARFQIPAPLQGGRRGRRSRGSHGSARAVQSEHRLRAARAARGSPSKSRVVDRALARHVSDTQTAGAARRAPSAYVRGGRLRDDKRDRRVISACDEEVWGNMGKKVVKILSLQQRGSILTL
ncbi:hypothetical protein NPX13_g2708 [Xylaria arbuscula]|uniref:Uncharacterized protein n=1 Tax=Xylaria arbuscula TaxID=114810 RepID=A0A9W8TNW8_9PEZI|nr:hypothetical protein NPX13_g2708 [Xylaria arbuscula]